MSSSLNREVWNHHYGRSRSILLYPDEYVVRYFTKLFNGTSRKLTILDLGCGGGRHLKFLSQYSSSCFGQDFAITAFKEIKNFGGQAKSICAKADTLPFRDNSFDAVLSWGVLHYLSNQEIIKAISEIYRILKPRAPFLGTLRSKLDTHLSWVLKEGDLEAGQATLYGKKKALRMFRSFSEVRYGLISREPLDSGRVIAHHVIEAIK